MTRPLTLVTGGSRGIGAATVRRLAAAGHDVVIGYRTDEQSAQALADEVSVRGGVAREPSPADVTDPAAVDALFDAAAEVGPAHRRGEQRRAPRCTSVTSRTPRSR